MKRRTVLKPMAEPDLGALYADWIKRYDVAVARRLLEKEVRARKPGAWIEEWMETIMTVERRWLAENGSPIPLEPSQTMH